MNEPSSLSWQGKMLGRYQVTRFLGRGGMGEVWLAEDTQLRRQIAVKLLPAAFAHDQQYLQAFEREARAAAALDHPNILPVHDFGQQQVGADAIVTYLVMPYIADGSLRERIHAANGPLAPAEALHYLRQAAQAIDYAHERHVLHRDVKPANMLLQQNWLFLTDFGIARLLDSATQRTQTRRGAGTPGFMAPEQAQGKAEAASDRYSLAVTAYVLLTGRQPFTGETPYGILIKQLQDNPPLPRELNPALSPLTQQVLLWGLARRPEDRPPSCTAFVQALEQSFQPQGVSPARGDADKTVLAPWMQYRQAIPPTQPPLAAPDGQQAIPTTASMPMPPALLPVHLTPYGNGTQTAPPQGSPIAPYPVPYASMTQMPTTPSSSSPATPSMPTPVMPSTPSTSASAPKIARRSVLIGAGVGAVALAGLGIGGYELYRHLQPAPHIAAKPIPGPHKLMSGVPVLTLKGHAAAVESIAWDPTGRYLASGSDDTYVMLWDVEGSMPQSGSSAQAVTGPLHKWKVTNSPNGTFLFGQNWLCWSNDGKTLSAITQDNHIQLFDAFSSSTTSRIFQKVGAQDGLNGPPMYTSVAWSPTSNTFATYDINYESHPPTLPVDLWRTTQANKPARTLTFTGVPASVPGLDANIDVLAWSSDGSLLAAHTFFNTVIIWDINKGAIQHVINLPDRPSPTNNFINNECLAWSPVDPHILVISDVDIAMVWDVQQNKQIMTLKLNEPGFTGYYVWGMSWAPNGQYMTMCYPQDPRIYIWDMHTTGASTTLGTTRTQMLFFPPRHAYGHTKAVTDVAWSPDGRYIASAGADNIIIIWKVDAE